MTWRKCPVPVIAAVHGVCFGGGLQIASGADIRVVHPATRMAVMEMKWGLVPDMGGYALWRGLVRDDVLRELTYTNREFSGADALGLGFATMVEDDPLARATAIAETIANKNPQAIRGAKRLFKVMQEERRRRDPARRKRGTGSDHPHTQSGRGGHGRNAEARTVLHRRCECALIHSKLRPQGNGRSRPG